MNDCTPTTASTPESLRDAYRDCTFQEAPWEGPPTWHDYKDRQLTWFMEAMYPAIEGQNG